MNFWLKIATFFRRESNGETSAVTPRRGATPLLGLGGASDMNIAAVYRCVRLLSESVANLPLQYLKYSGGIYVDGASPRLDYLLNTQPDFSVNAFDFWRRVVQNVLFDGNAYIIPVYNRVTLELDRLALCERGTVNHDTVNDTYTVNDLTTGIQGTYSEGEVIHIKGLPGLNSKQGVSVLTYARLTTATAQAGESETYSRFANGGKVRGIVSNDRSIRGMGQYQDEQVKSVATDIEERLRNGDWIVNLPGHTEFTQISLSSADMQFLESRKFTVREICRFFGVHPSFVFDDTSNNYKSAEQANVAFLSHTLNPLLRCIEVELRRKLIAPGLAHKYKFQFDRRGLYACDLDGMMKYRTSLLQTGSTVNEVRRMDNLPPIEGGDIALVSANLRSLAEIGTGQQTQQSINNSNDEEE